MSDTIGSLIDKLCTIDLKMFNAQEILYKIRHMTYEEFKEEFFNEQGMEQLWAQLSKALDLNLQRNQLIDEVDAKIIEMMQAEDLSPFIQKKHKTY